MKGLAEVLECQAETFESLPQTLQAGPKLGDWAEAAGGWDKIFISLVDAFGSQDEASRRGVGYLDKQMWLTAQEVWWWSLEA